MAGISIYFYSLVNFFRSTHYSEDQLAIHRRVHNRAVRFYCFKCKRRYATRADRDQHLAACRRSYEARPLAREAMRGSSTTPLEPAGGEFVQVMSALGEAAVNYRHTFAHGDFNLGELKRVLLTGAHRLLTNLAEENEGISLKWTATLFLEFYLASDTTTVTDPPVTFRSEPFVLMGGTAADDLTLQLQAVYNHFLLSAESFAGTGSGYVISRLLRLEISTIEYDPIRTGTHMDLPLKFRNPYKGLYNPKSSDNKCLLYCLAMWHLMRVEEAADTSSRESDRPHRNRVRRMDRWIARYERNPTQRDPLVDWLDMKGDEKIIV